MVGLYGHLIRVVPALLLPLFRTANALSIPGGADDDRHILHVTQRSTTSSAGALRRQSTDLVVHPLSATHTHTQQPTITTQHPSPSLRICAVWSAQSRASQPSYMYARVVALHRCRCSIGPRNAPSCPQGTHPPVSAPVSVCLPHARLHPNILGCPNSS